MQRLPLLLASVLFLGGAMQLRADEVTLTTALSTGSELQLALNADLRVTLEWGNGSSQTVICDGSLQSYTVQDADLTISSVSGKITSLYVQGNSLTALDVSKAINLKTLLAADNQLTTLDLSNVQDLVTLDVQGNQLTNISLSAATSVKDVNVASNQITNNLGFSSSARPTFLVAAGNQIGSAPSSSVLRSLRTYWMQNNNLSSILRMTYSTNLRSLCVSNNSLPSLTLPDTPLLTDIWVDNNKLTKLDLSGAPKIVYVSADHNSLGTITWDSDCSKTLEYAYLQNNALFVNSMPTLSSLEGYCIMPQGEYEMDEDYYDLNTGIDLSSLLLRNGWNRSITSGSVYTFTEVDGKTLTSGTDYDMTSARVFTFLTAQRGVQLHLTNSRFFSDAEFTTSAFNVGVPVGISDVTTDKLSLSVSGQRGMLRIDAPQATQLRVYSLAGACVTNETISQGSHAIVLPAGVYVVNGKKVIVF